MYFVLKDRAPILAGTWPHTILTAFGENENDKNEEVCGYGHPRNYYLGSRPSGSS